MVIHIKEHTNKIQHRAAIYIIITIDHDQHRYHRRSTQGGSSPSTQIESALFWSAKGGTLLN